MASEKFCANGSAIGTNDPVCLLKSEHVVLLGQLRLLERAEETGEETVAVLRTLIRDSAVHFRREVLLFRALGPKLGSGGRSLCPLTDEHRALRRNAERLLKDITLPRKNADTKGGARRRLRQFTRQFRAHIQHEEKVVYLLAQTRLTEQHRSKVAKQMLVK